MATSHNGRRLTAGALAVAASILILAASPGTPPDDGAAGQTTPLQATPSDELLARLAIDLAADGDQPSVEARVDTGALFTVFDRFRLTALAARAALTAGHPLDASALPPELLLPRVVILAHAHTPLGGMAPRPESVRLLDASGRTVKSLGVLTPDEVAALLPGIAVPALTMAVAFETPVLPSKGRVIIVFNSQIEAMTNRSLNDIQPGQTSWAIAYTSPKALATPQAVVPAGVTVPAGRFDVHVEGVLDLNGVVRYARALDGPADLRAIAVDTVSRWRYEPARLYAAPVPLVMQAVVTFHH
jgi:hypothetical protein